MAWKKTEEDEMVGPIRFVFSVLWLAIALNILGTLRSCTSSLGSMAAHSQQEQVLELGKWNRVLNGK